MHAALEKKATDVIALDIAPLVSTTDYFVIASGSNDRQVAAIADEIEKEMLDKLGAKPLGIEGRAEGRWVLLDYVDVIVHVFMPEVRDEYRLERLWGEAKKITPSEDVKADSSVSAETH